jgi:hypothetical protein
LKVRERGTADTLRNPPLSRPGFLGDLAGLGRDFGGAAQNQSVLLRPHMSTPDTNEGSYRNYNKSQCHCILHYRFSFIFTSERAKVFKPNQ